MGGSALSTALAQRANELLGDGQWHNYEMVVSELSKLIPPGRAIRKNELNRRAGTSRRGSPAPEERRKPLTTERQIAGGARAIISDFLRNTAFEVERGKAGSAHNPNRQVRQLRPHRSLVGDPWRLKCDQLKYEIEQLQARQDRLVSYLKDNGHAEAVDRLLEGRPEI